MLIRDALIDLHFKETVFLQMFETNEIIYVPHCAIGFLNKRLDIYTQYNIHKHIWKLTYHAYQYFNGPIIRNTPHLLESLYSVHVVQWHYLSYV